MKSFLFVLVFAMGEIGTGFALRCNYCKAIGKEDCTGESVECGCENAFCTKGLELSIINGVSTPTASRGCKTLHHLCEGPIVWSTSSLTVISSYECCHTDNCNSDEIELPALNFTKNGIGCKSCFEEDTLKCTKYETIDCIGDQEECFSFCGLVVFPGRAPKLYAIAGCAKKGACNIEYKAIEGTFVGYPRNLTYPKEHKIIKEQSCKF